MNNMTRELIHERALALFHITQNELNDAYEVDTVVANAFKYAFLILRKPKLYLENFEGALEIPIDDVDAVFLQFADQITGMEGLLESEERILVHHNNQCKKYSCQLPTVVPRYADRKRTIGLGP